jgi:hypothetical protein
MDGELRRALGRKEPSAGFADRVMQALPAGVPATPTVRQAPVRRHPRYWAGLAAAASLAIAIAGGRMWSEQRAIRQAERTQHDVEVALRLTSEKLNSIQARLTALSAKRTASHENAQQQ